MINQLVNTPTTAALPTIVPATEVVLVLVKLAGAMAKGSVWTPITAGLIA